MFVADHRASRNARNHWSFEPNRTPASHLWSWFGADHKIAQIPNREGPLSRYSTLLVRAKGEGKPARYCRILGGSTALRAAQAGGDVCGLLLARSPYHGFVPTYVWARLDLEQGLGLVRLEEGNRIQVDGHEVAVDRGKAWTVTFRVDLDRRWRTRRAQLSVVDDKGERTLHLEADGKGNWLVDGVAAPELAGCLDVDIAATPFTNTFVIRRLGLAMGEGAEVRAAWVSIPSLEVAAVDQSYLHLEPDDAEDRYEYRSGGSPEGWIITVDSDGVALNYQDFAERTFP